MEILVNFQDQRLSFLTAVGDSFQQSEIGNFISVDFQIRIDTSFPQKDREKGHQQIALSQTDFSFLSLAQ